MTYERLAFIHIICRKCKHYLISVTSIIDNNLLLIKRLHKIATIVKKSTLILVFLTFKIAEIRSAAGRKWRLYRQTTVYFYTTVTRNLIPFIKMFRLA